MGGFCSCYTAPCRISSCKSCAYLSALKHSWGGWRSFFHGSNQFSALICFRLPAKLLQGENSPFRFLPLVVFIPDFFFLLIKCEFAQSTTCIQNARCSQQCGGWMSNKQSGRAPDSPFHHFRIDYVLSSPSRWISSMPKAPPMCNLIGGLPAVTSLCAGFVNVQCYLTPESGEE